MADLTALQSEVEGIGTVTQSVEALIERLATELENTGTDQGAIDALVNELRTSKTALADAVVRGTEAEPDGEPNPNPTPGEGEGTETGGVANA